jgi:hypothetical protein
VVCHGTGGMQQWSFDVETPGKYYIHTLHASDAARPVRLFINGRQHKLIELDTKPGDNYNVEMN